MSNGTIPFALSSQSVYRPANKVEMFCLFSELSRIAEVKSGGQPVPDGTACTFTRQEIEDVLLSQQVYREDLTAAIAHCVKTYWLEEQADGFHVTRQGLANYWCMVRRV